MAWHGQIKLKKIQEIVKKVYRDKALMQTQLLLTIKRQNRRMGGGSEKSHRESFHHRYRRQSGD
jgi:hypothetical protein